jgi:phage terminase large subunit GpA-like protein
MQAAVDPRRRVLDWWAETWRPRIELDRAKWCEQNLRMPAEVSAKPGACDLVRYAYMREPLLAADDPNVEVIVLVWATQLGKTTLLIFILASQAAIAPVQSLFVAPDKDALMELRDKFYLFAEHSPLERVLPPPRLRNNRWMDAGRLRCHLAYPMNTQRLSGKSCALVLATEVDRYRSRKEQGSPEKLAAERVKAFFSYKIVYESSPTDDTSRIWKLFETSDRRQFHVPCPRCNHFQELRLFPHREGPFAGAGGIHGLKDGEGKWRTPDQARAESYYICERGCKITDDKKPAMVSAGLWCPKGQSIDKRGRLTGDPERGPRIWGGQLNSLYAEPITFGRFAGEYLESRDDPGKLQSFWQNWMALRWQRKAEAPHWATLGRRLRGGHPRGTVPVGAIFLTAGADVGPDYCRWVVRAFGEGSTSWLVDWGTTRSRPDADGAQSRTSHLDQLAQEILHRDWQLVDRNPLGEDRLRVRLLAVDCGYKPSLIHGWARKQPGDRVYTVAGRADLKSGDFYRCNTVEKDARTGKPYPGGMRRWEINRALYNADVADRWRQPLDEAGAWWLTAAPLDEAEPYLRELVNEAPTRVKHRTGRDVIEWAKVDSNTPNHWWDCEVYARAAADMVTGGDWDKLAERAKSQRRPPRSNGSAAPGVEARDMADDFSAR